MLILPTRAVYVLRIRVRDTVLVYRARTSTRRVNGNSDVLLIGFPV